MILILAFGFHFLAVYFGELLLASIFFTILSAIPCTWMGLMPFHEGSHASTTDSPFMWTLLGSLQDFVNGTSYYTWLHQHFLGHHPFTNMTKESAKNDSFDPDITTNDPDIRRIKKTQNKYSHYNFQQIYAPFLYSFLAIKFRFNDFLVMLVYKSNGYVKLSPPTAFHWIIFFGGKSFWLTYRIIIPSFFLPFWQVIILYILYDIILSLYLALTFQVNHVVPQTVWPTTDKNGYVNMDWAEMQILTTMDYAHNSKLTTFLTGALNYQVVHHLFPGICQIYYPDIAPIVREHCKRYKIKYNILPTFLDAFKAHLEYLRIMGCDHSEF